MPILRNRLLAALAFLLLASAGQAAPKPESGETVTRVHIGGFSDLGRIQKTAWKGYQGEVLQRTGAFLAYHSETGSRFGMDLNIGTLFWKPSNQDLYTLYQGSGINVAKFNYAFTEALRLDFGLMDYKYNPDSRNLGEYLFRSEAYPTLVKTGGWSFLNASSYRTVGTVLGWQRPDGAFRHQLLFLAEYENSPIWDITPAYFASWSHHGFSLFGGIALHRYLAADDRTTNHPRDYKVDSVGTYYDREGERWYLDPVPFRAEKLTAGSSLDFNTLLGWDCERIGRFGVYGETALLGWRNYAGVYTDRWERTPMMAGLHIPVGRILSSLSLEAEYLRNGYLDNLYNVYESVVPLPYQKHLVSEYHRDDWKWSVNAVRSLIAGLEIHAQVASDHLRLRDNLGSPSDEPITTDRKHWYYIFRLQYVL